MEPQLKIYKVQDWIVLGRNRFAPPFKASDTLINEARIVHVVHGRSNLYAANQYTQLQAGDTVIMKPDNFINSWSENPSGELNEIIGFQLPSDFLKFVYQNQAPQWLVSKPSEQVFPIQKATPGFLLDNYFENLKHYLDHPTLISEELLRMKVQELIYILINTDKTGSTQKLFGALFMANEYKFQEVIQAHLFDNLNLEDLAFLTGLSLSSFKRKFSAVYGTSPNKYFISKRLEQAQVLLSTTQLRISEIAYDCGFSDVGYFTKTFQKYYNCSPTAFRENLLN
ncbi:hypothetical protein BKI52_33165 [marine bacterium AO1-C]|nr:hypothetical protein BKI52_33165 [marine bacterium AO1-C]